MKKFTKRSLPILLALVMLLALSAVPVFADDVDRPTSSMTTTIPGLTSATIGGETAVFEIDNNGPTKFIRAFLDTEYDLQSADIELHLASGATISDSDLTFDVDGTTYSADNVDLLNEAYNLTINYQENSTECILAADVDDETIINISPSDPLKVEPVTIYGENATVYGRGVNGYAGNPWYEEEDQDGVNWVEVNYYVTASLSSAPPSRSAVPGTMGATGSVTGCATSTGGSNYVFDLSATIPNFTVAAGSNERVYRMFVPIEGDVAVTFGFDFTEAKTFGGSVATKAISIETDAINYFDKDNRVNPYGVVSVPSGTTVMDILEDFTNDMDYADKTRDASYISSIKGLKVSDTETPWDGWMYTDEAEDWGWPDDWDVSCPVPWVGADEYELTQDTTIIWFYTTDYRPHFGMQ